MRDPREFLTLEKGWNGYDADPPSQAAVDRAVVLLGWLGEDGLGVPTVKVSPSAIGGVGITFRNPEVRDRFVYLETRNSDGRAHIMFAEREEDPVIRRVPEDRDFARSLVPEIHSFLCP